MPGLMRQQLGVRALLDDLAAVDDDDAVGIADGGQAVGYFLTVPGRRFSGGRID